MVVDVKREVLEAEQRIRPRVRETSVERSDELSRLGGASVFLKLENLQDTGSFKVRGAWNKLLSLTPGQRARGVVTASTGNHGLAVAFVLRRLGAPGIAFVPEGAAPVKLTGIASLGVEVRTAGADPVESEARARSFAAREGRVYVSPYNDPLIVGGQGTIGLELARQLDRIDAVFVPLGGGGLVSGIASYLGAVKRGVRIIGCSPENSPVMIRSVRAGRVLDLPSLPTLSDGTAGGVEAGAITLDLCRALVDEYLTVTEDEIERALALFLRSHETVIEGAAAVALASYLKVRERFAGSRVVLVLSGGNIEPETLQRIRRRSRG
jgi:threonine dehydratase